MFHTFHPDLTCVSSRYCICYAMAIICCKCIYQMFQLFHLDLACMFSSGCCICCCGYIRMLQVYVPNVSSIFSNVGCKCVCLDVIYISHICCKCFIWMLHMFCNDFLVFLQVFETHVSSVSSVYTRMLQVFQLDVLKVDWMLHILQWRLWLADNGLQ